MDVSLDTVNRLWNETRGYSWESARRGLDNILSRDVISADIYDDMLWAINKLENIGEDFPTSPYELFSKINYYM